MDFLSKLDPEIAPALEASRLKWLLLLVRIQSPHEQCFLR